jgi:hypothetical protein
MTAWLLIVIVGLLLVCLVLYQLLQQTESVARGRQSLAAEDLRSAEAALSATLERFAQLDERLSRDTPPAPAVVPEPLPEPIIEPPIAASESPDDPATRLRRRALALHHEGLDLMGVAREIGLPVGAVELLLSLESTHRPTGP